MTDRFPAGTAETSAISAPEPEPALSGGTGRAADVPGGVVSDVADLFKVLSTPARVSILLHLREPATVNALVDATGISQPLVSQHLRVLRGASLVSVTRQGRNAVYAIADTHVTHVLDDAVTHAAESLPDAG